MIDLYRTSRNKLIQHTLDLLWRQWTSLGVPGNMAYRGDAILDPEALLLITADLGRYDSRLLDLAIDWLNSEGKRINLQRLKTLQAAIWSPDKRVISAIADILSGQAVMRKWKAVADVAETKREEGKPDGDDFTPPGREVLFLAGDDKASLPVGPDMDPHFLKYGLVRPPWKPRHACVPPPADRQENLLLTLRSFLGVNARAEIMAWLLTHDSGYAASIARDTGYFSKSIQGTLNEMEDSGLIVSERVKREKYFRLRKHDWHGLLGFTGTAPSFRWISWPWTYHYVVRSIGLLGEMDRENASASLRAIQSRGFLDEAAPWLRESGLRAGMSAERDMKGTRLTDAIIRDLETLGTLIQEDFRTPGPKEARAAD